jgi:hypothetical protein
MKIPSTRQRFPKRIVSHERIPFNLIVYKNWMVTAADSLDCINNMVKPSAAGIAELLCNFDIALKRAFQA